MKGYFSELARHTGLRIGKGVPTAVAASPALSRQPNNEVVGLAVEEVTFASPSQSPTIETSDASAFETTETEAAGNIFERGNAQRPERADSGRDVRSESDAPRLHKRPDPAIEVMSVNLTDSDSGAKRNLPSTEIETRAFDHPRVVISPPTSLDHQTYVSGQIAESVSALELRNARSATESNFGDPRREVTPDEEDPGRFPRSRKKSETGLDERVERQLVVRNYLKEIGEWISTPVAAEEEPASFISEDNGASTGDSRRAVRTNVSADRSPTAAPEQHDLTLSIGTIKIVVEEPPAQAAAPPAPPATTERTLERQTTAPTDLSRYYINRW